MRVAFMQVGADYTLASILVRSLRQYHPHAEIVQCSDATSPAVPGVDQVMRLQGNVSRLMRYRLEAFSRVPVDQATLFVDTDMICVGEIQPEQIVSDANVAVCAREFDNNLPFNIHFNGMNMVEHAGRSLGEVYPYIGCATVVFDVPFWQDCEREVQNLHPKYHAWYCDQEAIRNLVKARRYPTTQMRESIYACLPERAGRDAKLLHFKGAARKHAMIDYAKIRRL